MKFNVGSLLLFGLWVLCAVKHSSGARILAIVPTPSYSHQIPYRRLWMELNKRGHEIVLATTDPIPNVKAANFTQISLSKSYASIRAFDFVSMRFNGMSWIAFTQTHMWDMVGDCTEQLFKNTDMQRLYAADSNATFDVIMAEFLLMPATYAFANRFDAPMIGLCPLGMLALNEHALGGFVLPSHEYTWENEANAGLNLPFWQRLRNFVNIWRYVYHIYRDLFSRQQSIAEKYLGKGIPPLQDIMKNVSLIFVNQAEVLAPARPKLANMITFTSFHVDENPVPLPKDLKRFVDDAKEGFIYFSLGSNAMSSDLPIEVRRVFCDVFAKLPYRVVWKYEKEFPEKPSNVFVGKWLPQQSILGHPNIKLFIYQGGLQSSEESISFAVPVIGFPVLADQDYQTARMEALGVGKRLELLTVTREQLENAIKEIITNKEYKERMIQLRNLVKDTPYNLVDNLVWWTEYVIRHKGAPHLRSNLAWQPWYQRCDMDIVVFLTIVAFLFVSTILNIIAKIVVLVHKRLRSAGTQKQKIS